MYCLWLLLPSNGRAVYCQERLCVSPNATDLLSGPLQEVCQPLLRALLSERKSLFSYIDYCGLKEIRYSKGQSFPFKGLSEKESMGVLGYLFTSYRFSLTFIKNISTQIITLVLLSLFGKRDLVSN